MRFHVWPRRVELNRGKDWQRGHQHLPQAQREQGALHRSALNRASRASRVELRDPGMLPKPRGQSRGESRFPGNKPQGGATALPARHGMSRDPHMMASPDRRLLRVQTALRPRINSSFLLSPVPLILSSLRACPSFLCYPARHSDCVFEPHCHRSREQSLGALSWCSGERGSRPVL